MDVQVLELLEKDGNEYTPDTLYHIVCGVTFSSKMLCRPENNFGRCNEAT